MRKERDRDEKMWKKIKRWGKRSERGGEGRNGGRQERGVCMFCVNLNSLFLKLR